MPDDLEKFSLKQRVLSLTRSAEMVGGVRVVFVVVKPEDGFWAHAKGTFEVRDSKPEEAPILRWSRHSINMTPRVAAGMPYAVRSIFLSNTDQIIIVVIAHGSLGKTFKSPV